MGAAPRFPLAWLALLYMAAPLSGAFAAVPAQPPPELDWAYPAAAPGTPPLMTPKGTYQTPDGKRRLSAAQVEALSPADQDWFPRSHPAPPAVVLSVSRQGAPAPCAECHAVNGQGMVGVPDLAGLRADYLLEQLAAFRSGTRTSSQPGRVATEAMIEVAKGWSEGDLKAAAAYFASLPRHPSIRIIVADTVPPMLTERFGWTYLDPRSGPARPLHGAVAEAPESIAKVFMGDLSGRERVYVAGPTLSRGQTLVHAGGAAGQPCATCHGPDLRGTKIAPPLAGRDPGYLARQLWDIRSGARWGPSVAAMQAPARGLTPGEITAVAAYLASLEP